MAEIYRYDELTDTEVVARIRAVLNDPLELRVINVSVSFDKIFSVDVGDITPAEESAVLADLRLAYPRAMSTGEEPICPYALSPDAALVWTNMPLVLTEFRALTVYREVANLQRLSKARLIANVQVIGSANAELRVQYAPQITGAGQVWANLDGLSDAATQAKVGVATAGMRVGPEFTIASAARLTPSGGVLLRIVGINGDGVADPSFGCVELLCK